MTQRERESLAQQGYGDSDPHSLLFGDDHGDYSTEYGEEPVRMTRADRRRSSEAHRKRHRRRGRFFVLLTIVIVAAVAVFVVPRVIDYFSTPDYSGTGTGSTQITVHPGDSAGGIADTLKHADVVKSTKAFTDAASANSKSQSIQPGVYKLRKHMSGKAALAALLNPSNRDPAFTVVVPEGATSLDVVARLTKSLGADKRAAIDKALKNSANLGVPVNYKTNGKFPTSLEGFLYPATYTLDPTSTAQDALTNMVQAFVRNDRTSGFANAAAKVNLTPYQALVVASVAQSEAKYPQDMPKVVRTILNRVHAGMPLQFDSTSSYACKLAGTAATSCIYNQVDSPYNSYTHRGLPPTPIDNPGSDALDAAVHPAAGNWLYFVNGDKDGHLVFTADAKAFEKDREKCSRNHWGCA